MKKILALALCLCMALPQVTLAATDDRVFTDPVANAYSGRSEATELIKSLNFTDVPNNHWAGESIARSGALDMIKGYGSTYGPNKTVTNEEAISFVMRAVGHEGAALEEAKRIQNRLDLDEGLRSAWSMGYISLAREMEIITNAEYNDLTNETSDNYRTSPVERQRVAHWLVTALNTSSAGLVDPVLNEKRAIYNFSDWDDVDVNYAASVEYAASRGMMRGDSSGKFNPTGRLTRAEMAQVLRNMDSIYYLIAGIQLKTGTVGGTRDNQQSVTGYDSVWKNYYIRTSNGGIDLIQYQLEQNSQGARGYSDVVVYKNGKVTGLLEGLAEGDQIEYLVDIFGRALYVQVLNPSTTGTAIEEKLEGTLHSVDIKAGTITIQDDRQKSYVYKLMDGVYGTEGVEGAVGYKAYIMIDQKKNDVKELPIGYKIRLNTKNKTVDTINFIGNVVLIPEERGIVIENNTDFGYLTYINNNGKEVTKSYYEDSIKVEKQQYYDSDDEIGYLDEVFANFEYDPRDTVISEIEPGDIVFMRFDKEDPNYITNLSASTNYVARYGKIKQITTGDGISRYLVEYENKETTWFDVADGIFISKSGKPIASNNVKVGDWAKFLVNQAIISPGHVMESVKEINLEGNEHFISNIVKGQLSGIDSIQKKLVIQNAQTLSKTGWTNHNTIESFSINSNEIEYYHGEKRVSLDYAEKFLKRSEGEVYIALENSASGERVKKVTFRTGRDELLKSETVLTSDGSGSFNTISNNITTDSGTIVRRHGRLVDNNNILPSDFTVVSLNGGNNAAVVDITDTPDITGISIARARVISVDEGKSFKVQSMSMLTGNNWYYTPVQREFTIGPDTIFFNEEGVTKLENFIDYSEESVRNKAYTVVYDGAKATMIYDAPYAKELVKGTIYAVDGDTASIKNAFYLDRPTGKWLEVSSVNATLKIKLNGNTLVGKNNEVISKSGLKIGDDVRILTDELPKKVTSASEINAFILFVEN